MHTAVSPSPPLIFAGQNLVSLFLRISKEKWLPGPPQKGFFLLTALLFPFPPIKAVVVPIDGESLPCDHG